MSLKRIVQKALSIFGYRLTRLPAESTLSFEIIEQKRFIDGKSPSSPSQGDLEKWFRAAETNSIHKWQHYFGIYERHFAPFRGKPIKILEIGVYKGGSLAMWKSYFGNDTTIVGIDINPACKRFEKAHDKIHVRIGDQESESFLASVQREFGPFDIVIDDGGHTTGQQIQSFLQLYFFAMKSDGIYLVEDLHTNYWPEYITYKGDLSFVDLASELVHHLHDVYRGKNVNLSRFDVRNVERFKALEVSNFCAHTRSIHFYDSVIVFERETKKIPYHEER